MGFGQVNITIVDGGSSSIVVPGASVQLVLGCSSAGTPAQVVATRSPSTLQSVFGFGPLPEAAALTCLQGGTVLAMKTTQNAAGTATSTVYTGSGTASTHTSVTLDGTVGAFDDYYVQVLIVQGGTLATSGTSGITFQVSLDAGRTFGPVLALAANALSYAVPNTGVTVVFGLNGNTMVAGDFIKFSTTAPAWNDAGVQACLNAILAGPYAGNPWGSTHVVGISAGADATAIEGYLDTLAAGFVYTRTFVSARDAHAPIAWGGAGETESAWVAALQADYSAVSGKRICAGAGYYNTPSAFPTTVAGAPRYRRPLAWSAAARQVTAPPQRHIGRVRDGALSTITVSPTTDPLDGFIYHDESVNPGLDYLITGSGTARFMAAMTRKPNLPGFYVTNPLTTAPLGSDFYLMPLGSVMDVVCGLVHQVGQQEINDDVRLNNNGTLYVNDALAIQQTILNAINANITSANMISSATVVVDQTNNVAVTKNANIAVTITARGYVLEETVTIGFNNTAAAQAA